MEKIITASDYGDGSVRGYIRKSQRDIHVKRGISVTIKDIDGAPAGDPVLARIWQGQWIADCECLGASMVDPADPVFFCFSCGNLRNGSYLRPVTFPDDYKVIEAKILERPVEQLAGLTELERVAMAVAVLKVDLDDGRGPLPLTRSWRPGESIEDLKIQQDSAIEKWKKEKSDGI